jgi:MFS transporter, ACS family, tartrate transporter
MSEQQIFAKCAWRLIPFMTLLYLLSVIDRVNVGFAALTMNRDLHFSPTVYGFGAGILFVGYFLCSVPSNVALTWLGARRGIFLIMAIWGAISAAQAFVQGPASFYALRFLLGVAEAGFYPGMVLYLTYWFPKSHRARFTASFIAAAPLAFIIGGPLSGLILQMNNVVGLHGWQWLLLLEGLPAFLLSFAALKFLPNNPSDAPWLSRNEKDAIGARLAAEDSAEHYTLWPALRDWRVLSLCLVLFGIGFARFGIGLWLPLIVQGMGFSNLATGFAVASPYVAAVGAMILWGRSSDQNGERIWHIAAPVLVAVTGLILASLTHSDLLLLFALSCTVVCIEAMQGPFWSLPSSFLGGTAAAGGIGLIAATGQLGAFFGSSIMGVLKEATGGYASGMMVLAGALAMSATVVLALGRAMTPEKTLLSPKLGGGA